MYIYIYIYIYIIYIYIYIVASFPAYLQGKNQLHPRAFLEILQDIQTYLGYFGHAWLHTPKMIVSTFRRLRCLSAWQK